MSQVDAAVAPKVRGKKEVAKPKRKSAGRPRKSETSEGLTQAKSAAKETGTDTKALAGNKAYVYHAYVKAWRAERPGASVADARAAWHGLSADELASVKSNLQSLAPLAQQLDLQSRSTLQVVLYFQIYPILYAFTVTQYMFYVTCEYMIFRVTYPIYHLERIHWFQGVCAPLRYSFGNNSIPSTYFRTANTEFPGFCFFGGRW